MKKAITTCLLGFLASIACAVDFERDIQPILEFHCVACHNEEKTKGGLRFDKADLFHQGGDGGPALVAGKPDDSLLIELVSLPSDDDDVMPPKGRTLTEAEIAKLREWIKEGAKWPADKILVAKKEEDFKGADPLPDRGKKIVKVAVYPEDIVLETRRDSQSVVVMATYEDDTTLDVTPNSTFTFTDPSLIELESRNRFWPR